MNAIQKSAGLDAKTAAKNGGYSFTHMLQSELNTAGYPFVTKGPLKVDGVFGPKTQAAYAEFVENAPRLLGEGGAQATLSAARTPSADPTMRVSPDTEIIPVEIQNPVEPLEPPSDYIIRGARNKANTILSEMIAEQHSIIPWYRDLGTWNYNDSLYGGELKKQLKDLEIESSTTNATVELAKIAYAFATESNAPLTGYEIDALAHAYQIPITPAASQMIARVVNTGIAYVSPGGMSDMLPDDFIASIKGILQKRAILEEQLAYLEDSGYSYLFTNMDNAHREDFIKDIRKQINQLERDPIQKFRDMKKNQYYNDEIIFMLERIVEMNTNYESNLTKLKKELSAIEKKYH